jgi:glycosyltransferase involved in cell wall biosynthesis
MKILYWTSLFVPDLGGIQVLAANSLPRLAERGYEILVIASHGRMEQPDVADFRGIPVRRFHFWSALMSKDLPRISEIKSQILELKEAFRPEVIHINFSGYTAFFQVATAKQLPIPTVLALHGGVAGSKVESGTTLEKLFNLVDWVTAISDWTLANAREVVPGIIQRSSVIRGCPADWPLGTEPSSLGGPCVLGIGRLQREKGFDLLIEAFGMIVGQFPQLSLRIIGDGPERPALERQASQLGLQGRVEFPGSMPNGELPRYISQASLVAVPSRYVEPFGLVAVEAARMGKAVVAANTGGLAEIVVNNETGLLVEPDNARALAEAIAALLSKPEEAERMGLAGRARAEKEFSLNRYVAAYDKLYQQLAAGKRAASRKQ